MPIKKLIEVSLPLNAINEASAREKSIRHGHPSTLHLWWARRPLASSRAVLFAQMVDDPSSHPSEFPTKAEQDRERDRLFDVLSHLVTWESTTDERVLERARDEIRKSWRRTCALHADDPDAAKLFNPEILPTFHDPFAGGGALPLEAQRLGFRSIASDLNPVATLINKAMIEIPPRFAGMPPVNPASRDKSDLLAEEWPGATGLAADVRYYGDQLRQKASEKFEKDYPTVRIDDDLVRKRPDLERYRGRELTVLAWLWARTVKSPNPAFADVNVPLVSSFILSPMAGKSAYVAPVIRDDGYEFDVRSGEPPDFDAAKLGTSVGKRAGFRCLMSGVPINYDYIRDEGQSGRLGMRLLAVVAEGDRERVYLPPFETHESVATSIIPGWRPTAKLQGKCRVNVSNYGLDTFGDLFTHRQANTLTGFSDLVLEIRDQIRNDGLAAGLPEDSKSLDDGGNGVTAYADAVAVYLSFLVSKLADKGSTLCTWDSGPKSNRTSTGRSARVATVRVTFGRQALPMSWDFAEVNFFSDSVGSIGTVLNTLTAPLENLPRMAVAGRAEQADAQTQSLSKSALVVTDPPYYDNIDYADLSDFFYVWLRRTLKPVFPRLFSTVAVPKSEELVATAHRHGGKDQAERFFLEGMKRALGRISSQSHPDFPVSIYYAFKQAERSGKDGTSSTGWETFLAAVIEAGFAITGTWPIRTEMGTRMVGSGANALASSIVLVCRRRSDDLPIATRREFVASLRNELPVALTHLQAGNIAPVDLAQASIGPGMAIYTRYGKVLDAEGRAMSVHTALALINQTLDEALAEQEGDFDADSRWALSWFEQFGFQSSDYGTAETLSKAKNTSVAGLVEAGILESRAGRVRLLRPDELPRDWNPSSDTRLTLWEIVHQLIRILEEESEGAAAALVARLGEMAEISRELAYRLFSLCERKNRSKEALSYNSLVRSWPEIQRIVREANLGAGPEQQELI